MPSEAVEVVEPEESEETGQRAVREKLDSDHSDERVIGFVGYAGSDIGSVCRKIAGLINDSCKRTGFGEDTIATIRATDVLNNYTYLVTDAKEIDISKESIDDATNFQNIGDEIRKRTEEYSAVAGLMLKEIQEQRKSGRKLFLLCSIKHPAEVDLLRQIYGDGFLLVGVSCEYTKRAENLNNKYSFQRDKIREYMARDEKDAAQGFGQNVRDAFYLADFFIDSTSAEETIKNKSYDDIIKRFVDVYFGSEEIQVAGLDEKGLYFSHVSSMTSSCLSRQVGAAILDKNGNIISTGSNDVPKPNGGLYPLKDKKDGRCFALNAYCTSSKERIKLFNEIFDALSGNNLLIRDGLIEVSDGGENLKLGAVTKEAVEAALKMTRVNSLIEFSRSIHAEMDALLGALRSGSGDRVVGGTLYTTTYPCHSCARHIVAAGISRVVYLEPYDKSMAIELHGDSIFDPRRQSGTDVAAAKGKVVFLPFVGVAPRLYEKVFTKQGELKDKNGDMIHPIPIAKRKVNAMIKQPFEERETRTVEILTRKIGGNTVE